MDECIARERGAEVSPPVKEACMPPRMELLQRYELRIDFQSVGCTVRIGCKSVCFQSTDEAMLEIIAYVKDPATSIEKWQKRFEEENLIK